MSNVIKNNCTDPGLIGLDLWKQQKRVTIPVFTGDKRTYQNWKAALSLCGQCSCYTRVQTATVEAVSGRGGTKGH